MYLDYDWSTPRGKTLVSSCEMERGTELTGNNVEVVVAKVNN